MMHHLFLHSFVVILVAVFHEKYIGQIRNSRMEATEPELSRSTKPERLRVVNFRGINSPILMDLNQFLLGNQEEDYSRMLFEILPVIVYQLAGPGLTELPMELIATILRYLDPEALLNVVRAYKTCKEVCLGDPILRRRLQTLLKQKKKLELEKVLNPKLGVSVTRMEGSGGMFRRNVIKKVKVNRIVASSERATNISKEIFSKPKTMMEPKKFIGSNRCVSYRL